MLSCSKSPPLRESAGWCAPLVPKRDHNHPDKGPKMTILYRMTEKINIWLAWHLPRSVVYWAGIRMGAHATSGCWGNECPSETLFITVLKRWEGSNEPTELASPVGAPWAADREGNISPFPELSEYYSSQPVDPPPASAEPEDAAGR